MMKLAIFLGLFYASAVWSQVQLISTEFAGSGCPTGSVRAVLAPDGSAFSVLYDQFSIDVGPQVATARKNCTVILHLKKPKRVGFRVDGADFRGFVGLDPGVVASQNVKVMSGPNPGHRMLSAEFGNQTWQGPINEVVSVRAVRPTNNKPPVLDCVPPKENTDIVIESAIQLSGGASDKYGQVFVDSADGLLLQKFSLTWINCSPGNGHGK